MRFWDSSALASLLINDVHTESAEAWYREDPEIYAWCMTPVEIWSAVCRERRSGRLGSPDVRTARERLVRFMQGWHEVDNVALVRQRCIRLLEVHELRAGDALQLAAALLVTQDRPDGASLLTFDSRLGTAADREGFSVLGAKLE